MPMPPPVSSHMFKAGYQLIGEMLSFVLRPAVSWGLLVVASPDLDGNMRMHCFRLTTSWDVLSCSLCNTIMPSYTMMFLVECAFHSLDPASCLQIELQELTTHGT